MSDLTQEQQQRVVERCADRGFTVAPSDDKPDSLQIIVDLDDPNDPLAKMENELFDQWLEEEAQRIEEMNETEWLSLLLGGFLAEKLFSSWENIFSSRRRKQPITLPDGTRCFTEDCMRHENEAGQSEKDKINYEQHDNPRADRGSEKERTSGVVLSPERADSYSEQGGNEAIGRELGRRVLLPEEVGRIVQESTRPYGADEETKRALTLTTTAQVQAVLDGRKPAFLEAFPELVKGVYNTIPHDDNIRYVAGDYEHCIYNADSVRKVLAVSANSSELDYVVKNLVDSGNSGMILGYGYNLMDNPRGWKVSIFASSQEISGFEAPPNRNDAGYYAEERTKDFRITFPELSWKYAIIER